MRLFSILTALLVSAGLYMLVFEREAVKAISSQDVPTDVIGAGASPPREETAIKPVSVVAIKSSERTIPQAVAISGLTEANRQVEVRAETAGTVISEPLRKGASVEAGEILCKIDPGIRQVSLAGAEAALAEARSRLPEAEARVSEAESRLAEATLNLNAASSLAQGGFASESRVVAAEAAADAARAGVKAAQSQLKSAKAGVQTEEANVASVRKDIERLEIRAPFAGLLESDTAELGSLLQPGGHCATVIQLDPIKLVGFVVETDIDKIRTGSRAGARLATGLDIAGQVTFISRSADPRTRTFRIEATVPNPDLATRRAHLVPQSALTLTDDGALGVRLVNDRLAASFFPVTVLRDSPDGVFVGGLDEVASVIVVGQEYVTDGVPVIPTYREGGQ